MKNAGRINSTGLAVVLPLGIDPVCETFNITFPRDGYVKVSLFYLSGGAAGD